MVEVQGQQHYEYNNHFYEAKTDFYRANKRDKIKIADCLVPYISFKRQEIQALLKWFKQRVITETKGVFSDIDESELGELAE